MRLRSPVSEAEKLAWDSEVSKSGLVEHLRRTIDLFQDGYSGRVTGRGREVSLGSNEAMGRAYYYLVRKYRPQCVVETGVCNGISSAFVLEALRANGEGTLHSIDYPEFVDGPVDDQLWSGKGGAAIPAGKEPGWMIPDSLRDRWTLLIGKSTDRLRPLLEELGSFDCFIHDSEHSYECMMYEYSVAWRHLKEGGILASNDIHWNRAFFDFCALRRRVPWFLTPRDGLIKK